MRFPPSSALRLIGIALLFCACKGGAAEAPPDAATSPQAKAEPAPLALVPSAASALARGAVAPDAGPVPEPMRSDEELGPDVLRESARELAARDSGRDPRELAGFAIQAIVRTGEGPLAPRAPEVNAQAIEAAKRKTEARMTIDLGAGRARFVLSGGFVLPPGTELRARVDRYGHLLLWPGETTYRIAEPGSLRALFGERRLDVAPLSSAEVRAEGEGPRRLNLRTRRVDVTTRAAQSALEIASLAGAGDAGTLVCRLLFDLMGAPPSARACGTDDVPLHAELRWTTRGVLTFDVTAVTRRVDLEPQDLSVPPPVRTLTTTPPPRVPAELLLPRADLMTFRTAPAEVPVPATRDAQPPAPDSGLVLINSSDELRVAWLDGAAVAWVAPGSRLPLSSMLRGRYALQWRTFLGDSWEPADQIIVPGASEVGLR